MEEKPVLMKLELIFRRVLSNDSLGITKELKAGDVDRWDSLTHMLLISEIENEFAIKFKLKELNKMSNVGDMVSIIISKLPS
jgi:acyl carrier protein